MQIYLNTVKHTKFERLVWKAHDDFLLRLTGLDVVVDKSIKIYPVYVPLFRMYKRAGQFVFELMKKDRIYAFLFQKAWPYFIFDVFKLELGPVEDED